MKPILSGPAADLVEPVNIAFASSFSVNSDQFYWFSSISEWDVDWDIDWDVDWEFIEFIELV